MRKSQNANHRWALRFLALALLSGCGGSNLPTDFNEELTQANTHINIDPESNEPEGNQLDNSTIGSSAVTPSDQEDNEKPCEEENGSSNTNNERWQDLLSALSVPLLEDFILHLQPDNLSVIVIPKYFRPMKKSMGSTWLFKRGSGSLAGAAMLDRYYLSLQLQRVAQVSAERQIHDKLKFYGFNPIKIPRNPKQLTASLEITRTLPINLEAFSNALDCQVVSLTHQSGKEVLYSQCQLNGSASNTRFQIAGNTSRSNSINIEGLSHEYPYVFRLRLPSVTLYQDVYLPMLERLQPGGLSNFKDLLDFKLHWYYKTELTQEMTVNVDWPALFKTLTLQLEQHGWQFNSAQKRQFFSYLVEELTESKGISWLSSESTDPEQRLALAVALEEWLTPVLLSSIQLLDAHVYAPRENPELLFTDISSAPTHTLTLGSASQRLGSSTIEFACLKTSPFSPNASEFFADEYASDCNVDEFFKFPN